MDHAWLAAYLLHQRELSPSERVPALILETTRETDKLARWYERHHPEVILYTGLPVASWVGELGLQVPDEVGLVHLDWSGESGPVAGIDADAEGLGVAAVDLLIGQLHAHEYGIPRREKIVSVSGRWVSGKSLHAMARAAAGLRPAPNGSGQ